LDGLQLAGERVIGSLPVKYFFWTKAGEALFATQLADPQAWVGRARMLRTSAIGLGELWRRDSERLTSGGRFCDCPYVLSCLTVLMLNGIALESLAKAIIADKNRATWGDIWKLPNLIKSHKLISLLLKAGVSLSDEERELAKRMTDLYELARYPVPQTPAGMRFGVPARLEDLEVISAMYARVEALVPRPGDIQAT